MPVTKTTTREALEDGVAPVELDENPGAELITRAEAEAIADRKAEAKVAEYHDWLLPKINEALGQLEDRIRYLGGGHRPIAQEARPQPPAFAMLTQVTQGRVRGDAAHEMRAKLNNI
jgi:hypothetical protein